MTLKDATPEKLVATLKNDNMFWRLHAQRLLVERGKQDVLPAPLWSWSRDRSVDAIGLNAGVDSRSLDTARPRRPGRVRRESNCRGRRGPEAQVRLACAAMPSRSCRATRTRRRAIVAAGLLKDTDLQVRLAALLALADLPPSPGMPDALLASLDPVLLQDRWLTDAMTCAAARDAGHFLPALARGWIKPLPANLVAVVERAAEHLRVAPTARPLTPCWRCWRRAMLVSPTLL